MSVRRSASGGGLRQRSRIRFAGGGAQRLHRGQRLGPERSEAGEAAAEGQELQNQDQIDGPRCLRLPRRACALVLSGSTGGRVMFGVAVPRRLEPRGSSWLLDVAWETG